MVNQTHIIFEQRLKAWRRAFLIGAILLALQVPVELHYRRWAVSLPLRLAWVALLLLSVPEIRPDRPRLAKALAYLGGFGSGIFASAIIFVTGGSYGPRFGFLLAFPLVVLVLAPDAPIASAAMGLATMLGGCLIMVHDQRDYWFIGEWSILSTTATGLAILGTLGSRHLARSERRVKEAHAKAAAELADAERAAVVGRLASTVAHRVANPLSVVRSNLWSLLESIQEGRSLNQETVEMLTESMGSVERVSRVLTEFRALCAPEMPTSCDLVDLVREAVHSAPGRGMSFEIEVDVPSGLPPIFVCRNGFVLATIAVLSNAQDDLSARHPSETLMLRISAHRGGDRVELRIAEYAEASQAMYGSESSRRGWLGDVDHSLAGDLALAREMLERSGASLEVRVASSGLNEAVIHLRLASAPAASLHPLHNAREKST